MVLGLMLAGCAEPGPEDALQTYLARLARTLDQGAPPVEPPQWQRLPRASELAITLEGSSLDALDFLAEITMSIMQKQRARDPEAGYARDFISLMERIFPACVEGGVRVVTNAGGVNPEQRYELVIDGDAGDTVNSSGWGASVGTVTNGGVTYDVYNQGTYAQLLIATDITQSVT